MRISDSFRLIRPLRIVAWIFIALTIAEQSTPISAASMSDARLSRAKRKALALPSPWAGVDIGNVGIAGSEAYSTATLTVKGSGANTESYRSDDLHFTYQPMNGDGEIVARVLSVQNTDSRAKASVMIRQSLRADSTHASMFLTAGLGSYFQHRATTGGKRSQISGGSSTAPVWVKVVRSGSTFSGYTSPDAVRWTLIRARTISMRTTVYVGLAVASFNPAALNTSTFDNVSVTPAGSPPPPPPPTVTISSLTVNPANVVGGNSSIATVALSAPAPAGGTIVTVTDSNQSVASVPSRVTIPAGSSSSTFAVATNTVAASTLVTISGSTGGSSKSAALTVIRLTVIVPVVGISSLTVNPANVVGGNSSIAAVALSAPAPAGGTIVTVTDSNQSVASVPSRVTIPAGSSSSTFAVATNTVAASTLVTISGSIGGSSKSAALTVGPAPPPGSDFDFYVAANGQASGNGSYQQPWNLATALAQPPAIRPGATIWLRGGTYSGSFISRLTGTQAAPITLRGMPGERAIIDGSPSTAPATLEINGAWTTYWGFEVTNSKPNRSGPDRSTGLNVNAPHSRFINLIVHDAGNAFGFWKEAVDAEIYGCLIFNNGVSELDHGIYAQNQTGTKHIVDNLIFNQYGFGIHIYGSSAAYLSGFHVEGNAVFNNGSIIVGTSPASPNILVGGGIPADQINFTSNYIFSPNARGVNVNLGYGDVANGSLTFKDNTIVGGGYSSLLKNWVPALISGNTIYGSGVLAYFALPSGYSPATYQWDSNRYYKVGTTTPFVFQSQSLDFSRWHQVTGFDLASTNAAGTPSGVTVFVRANQYEPGRGHLIIYNWEQASSVDVDVSAVLRAGASFEVRNAQDYFGPPVLSGIYDGHLLRIPMTNLQSATPVGYSSPPPVTWPTFNAFVVIQH